MRAFCLVGSSEEGFNESNAAPSRSIKQAEIFFVVLLARSPGAAALGLLAAEGGK